MKNDIVLKPIAYLETQALHLDSIFLLVLLLLRLLVALQRRLPLLLLLRLAASVELFVAQGVSLGLELDLLLFQRCEDIASTSREHWLLLLQERHDGTLSRRLIGLLGLGFRILSAFFL